MSSESHGKGGWESWDWLVPSNPKLSAHFFLGDDFSEKQDLEKSESVSGKDINLHGSTVTKIAMACEEKKGLAAARITGYSQ